MTSTQLAWASLPAWSIAMRAEPTATTRRLVPNQSIGVGLSIRDSSVSRATARAAATAAAVITQNTEAKP